MLILRVLALMLSLPTRICKLMRNLGVTILHQLLCKYIVLCIILIDEQVIKYILNHNFVT